MSAFLERLDTACETNKSLLCVGLDPDLAQMPISDVAAFNKAIVDATRDLVCAYKPNLAFYEALGLEGLRALEQTIQHIRNVAPGVVLIGDAKRGDIGNTAEAYARAMFDVWGFDATTVNPYGGQDAVQPFLDYRDRGVIVWCRSSNPGAGEIQNPVIVPPDGTESRPLYEWVAVRANIWNDAGNVALVVGATYPDELERVRELCPEMPILIPGVGAQEGVLEKSVLSGTDARGRRAIISASRGIIYAPGGGDFAEAAGRAAGDLRNSINSVLESDGLEW